MDHKRLISSSSITLTAFIVMNLFVRCSPKMNTTQTTYESLEGTFLSYQSALGSGRGVIFRIPLSEKFIKGYSVDSFYMHGEALDFMIRTGGSSNQYLEANYFVTSPQQGGMGDPGKAVSQPVSKKITDSVIGANRFYPSWILLNNGSTKRRVTITLFNKETVSSSNAKQ